MQRLVMAQDTGSAIVGAVRADYFAGWGTEAGELAGRLKQGLRLWALWPR
jgi:membrane-bound lytic murein transglycosylase A